MNINIYGIDYKIKEISHNEFIEDNEKTSKEYDDIHFGRHNPFTQEIFINIDLKRETKKTTLIHELCHAIMFVLGYGEMNEENLCDFIGAHHQFIQFVLALYFKEDNNE